MSKYEPSIAEVLSDASLVDNAIAKLPTIQEEMPKGLPIGREWDSPREVMRL